VRKYSSAFISIEIADGTLEIKNHVKIRPRIDFTQGYHVFSTVCNKIWRSLYIICHVKLNYLYA